MRAGVLRSIHLEKCWAEERQRGSGKKRNILPAGKHTNPAGSLRDEHSQMCSGSCGLTVGLRDRVGPPAGPQMFTDGQEEKKTVNTSAK